MADQGLDGLQAVDLHRLARVQPPAMQQALDLLPGPGLAAEPDEGMGGDQGGIGVPGSVGRGDDHQRLAGDRVQGQPVGRDLGAGGGGGRYDGRIGLLGGRPTPGIGFGSGIERIILNLKRQKSPIPELEVAKVYIAHTSEQGQTAALRLARRLRGEGVGVVVGSGGRSLKAQLRHADALSARYVAILGERELARGEVTLRDMRDGEQQSLAEDELARVVAAD